MKKLDPPPLSAPLPEIRQKYSTAASSPMRFALDVSKISSRDGIGSYTRGLLRALLQLESRRDFRLLNLLGGASENELRKELKSLFGELPDDVELDLGRWHEKTASEQALTFTGVDALLATSWTVPVSAPPSLFVVYDLTFLSHPQCHTLSNRLHCAEGLLRARLRGDRFTAISKESASQLEKYFGVSSGKVLVAEPAAGEAFAKPSGDIRPRILERYGFGIPAGMEPSEPGPDTPSAGAQLHEAQGYVLSVGSLEPRKNVERLLEAHAYLPTAVRRSYPLILVGGKGWRNAELEERLAAANPSEVRHLGAISEADLVDLFSCATVFVYPSLAEGFGLPVLEAMACGAPVITSTLSSLPEVAGDAALLVDPFDVGALKEAMETLLHDQEQRQALRQRGFKRADKFRWSRAAEDLHSGLEALARQNASG